MEIEKAKKLSIQYIKNILQFLMRMVQIKSATQGNNASVIKARDKTEGFYVSQIKLKNNFKTKRKDDNPEPQSSSGYQNELNTLLC